MTYWQQMDYNSTMITLRRPSLKTDQPYPVGQTYPVAGPMGGGALPPRLVAEKLKDK